MKKSIGYFLLIILSIQFANAQVSNKKNILFIAVDDLKPLLNSYGQTQMVTPNFDRLAKRGVIFENAEVQQAVCGPSRACVMTGTYPDRTKVWDLHTDFRESAPELISMPEYLISQGYETTAIGKTTEKVGAFLISSQKILILNMVHQLLDTTKAKKRRLKWSV